jgi:hypothetical protein
MHEVPSVEGICRELLQIHAPVLLAILKFQTRAEGHKHLVVPTAGPVLNLEVRQL